MTMKENKPNEIREIRQRIDNIDAQIQDLINQRAQCNLEMAKAKQQTQKNPVYYRPEREAQILRTIMKRAKGPIPAQDIAEIFLLILAKCRALQEPLKIAYNGAQKSFAHQATLKHFGNAVITKSCSSMQRVFKKVVQKEVNYGIVPVENSLEGVISETLDALAEFTLQICGEIQLISTKKIPNNITRFLLIGRDKAAPSGNDKTSLYILTANKPGALTKIFQPFTDNGINITFIEPHPYRKQLWNYMFFLDIEGHQQDQAVQQALTQLSQQPLSYTILGSYPKAVL